MTVNKCNPCWSHNISTRANSKLQCFIYWNYRSKISLCPCRKCLIKATCITRCEERFEFSSKGGNTEK